VGHDGVHACSTWPQRWRDDNDDHAAATTDSYDACATHHHHDCAASDGVNADHHPASWGARCNGVGWKRCCEGVESGTESGSGGA